jgi:GTPase SAR1 family protein
MEIPGHESDLRMLPKYLKGASGVVIVYDRTRLSTLVRGVPEWILRIQETGNLRSDAIFALVGGYSRPDDRITLFDDAVEEMQEKHRFEIVGAICTEGGTGIPTLVEALVQEMVARCVR